MFRVSRCTPPAPKLFGLSLAAILCFLVNFGPAQSVRTLIDLRDRVAMEQQRPLLIAHRGGVVTEATPECSISAIELAATSGYQMVELDVQRSRDGVPVVFHDQTLLEACGRPGSTSDHPIAQLLTFRYSGTSQTIVSLDLALQKCRALGIGVMLDLKHGRDNKRFLDQIAGLIARHELKNATVSISSSTTARRRLKNVMFSPTDQQMAKFRNGERVDLTGTFWFGLPERLTDADARQLKACGAYIFPAINTFRYPSQGHVELARKDIQRLMSVRVDGFQIDSVYFEVFQTLRETGNDAPADR